MARIVECVPNFSEGRGKEVVDQIVAAIAAVPGVMVLDVEMDPDHNRSVVTLAGEPEAVEEAAFQATKRAAQLIDLNQHKGEHPRIGATDVIPFVPIREVSMEECVAMARRLGERIARELSIPVYLYEKAATRPEREDLAYIRRGEYEALKVEMATNPEREPDFGPRAVGRAGATVVGAREPLIAYNVYLGTRDIEVAKKVAEAVRYSSGGLHYAKALGMEIAQRGLVQVSMNLTNYKKTPIHRALEMVRREAQRYGVPVVSSEIVGLVPEEALLDSAGYYLQLERFSSDQVLEWRLAAAQERREVPVTREEGLRDFLEQVASPDPVPGGGSVAAFAAALASSLISMVSQITIKKARDPELVMELDAVREEAMTLQQEFYELISQDGEAYTAVLDAYRQPLGPERQKAVQKALRTAAAVPMTVALKTVRALKLALVLAQHGDPNLASDVATAGYMAKAAISGAAANVLVNIASFDVPQLAEAFRRQVEFLEVRGRELLAQIEESGVQKKLIKW